MKKAIRFILLLIVCPGSGFCQSGAEALMQEAADHLQGFFMDKTAARTAIVQFENHSELTDEAMQKLYQLLTARLENNKNINASDLLLDFTHGRGTFNVSKVNELDYLIYLKLIQNKSKAGIGIVIFSRWQDKLVSLKYIEKNISPSEMEFLNASHIAFAEMGFSKLAEFECKENLLDIQSVSATDGPTRYFFYYPDEIIVFTARENRLEKESAYKLKWNRPFFPVLHSQGKLLIYTFNQALILTVGGNFSPYAQILTFSNSQWRETATTDFVPMAQLIFNGNPYLVGAQYDEGKNYFKDKICFMPFSEPAVSSGMFEKKIFPAYDIDFSTQDGQLQGIHLIDLNYRYHLLTADLAEKTPEPEPRGASLAVSDGHWLAVSDYSRQQDQIFFYDIKAGGQRPVYSGKIPGEIQFISAGVWQASNGFWVGSRMAQESYDRFLLQFWGKRND